MKKRVIDQTMSLLDNGLISLNAYPLPNCQRESYLSLNGKWDYFLTKKFSLDDLHFQKTINVPSAFKGKLSGANENLQIDDKIVYHRFFYVDEDFIKDINYLVVLGIDNYFTVYLNNKDQGSYRFFNSPLKIELTNLKAGKNEIIIVTQDLNEEYYPRGKQSLTPKGMFYTSTEGIYFPLFIESLPKNHIRDFKITTTLNMVKIDFDCDREILVKIYEGDELIFQKKCLNTFEHKFSTPHLWDVDDPFLYDVTFTCGEDEIKSYFGLREISINKDDHYVYLNNKRIFLNGLLDQGYYLDGIVTPKSYSVYKEDLKYVKQLGFNCLRKHIKIECPYFYYLCDKFGILLIQDFINNSHYSYLKETVLPTVSLSYQERNTDSKRSFLDKYYFIKTAKNIVNTLYNHPSVIAYTIFNEGWGQFQAEKMYYKVKSWDKTRLIDTTSGWFRNGASDFLSLHIYFRKISDVINKQPSIAFISEFGGYVYKEEEHIYNLANTYGYKGYEDNLSFQKGLNELYNEVYSNIDKLSDVIYTQFSDVEDELNGLITYDRKVKKITDPKLISLIHKISNYGK